MALTPELIDEAKQHLKAARKDDPATYPFDVSRPEIKACYLGIEALLDGSAFRSSINAEIESVASGKMTVVEKTLLAATAVGIWARKEGGV